MRRLASRSPEASPRRARSFLALLATLAACASQDADRDAPRELVFGPADGHDLPGTELERVRVGDVAPDFTLASLGGPPVTLSDFRGQRRVILVFYRGQW